MSQPQIKALTSATANPFIYQRRIYALGAIIVLLLSGTLFFNFGNKDVCTKEPGVSVHIVTTSPEPPEEPEIPLPQIRTSPKPAYRQSPVVYANDTDGFSCSDEWESELDNSTYTLMVLLHGNVDINGIIRDSLGTSRLSHIVFVWNNVGQNPPELPQSVNSTAPNNLRSIRISMLVMPRNSLLNRFKPFNIILTRVVYHMDNDIRLPPVAFEFMFDTWRENQNKLIGPAYRVFSRGTAYWDQDRMDREGYDIVLTGSSFITLGMMRQFTCGAEYGDLRDSVDKNMNCEDLVMNFVYAKNGGGGLGMRLVHNQDGVDEGCRSDLILNGRVLQRSRGGENAAGLSMKNWTEFSQYRSNFYFNAKKVLGVEPPFRTSWVVPALDVAKGFCAWRTAPPA